MGIFFDALTETYQAFQNGLDTKNYLLQNQTAVEICCTDCCDCTENDNQNCATVDGESAIDQIDHEKVMLFLIDVLNWSWVEEIVIWDTCLEPLQSVQERVFIVDSRLSLNPVAYM